MTRPIPYGNGEENKQAMKNTLTDLLECQYPVMLAGMGGVSRHELAVAVTKAGGFGCLGMVREEPSFIKQEISKFRALTNASFGVNLIPAATNEKLLSKQLEICIEEAVPVVVLFWDVDRASVDRLKQGGVKVIYQVGSHRDAKYALDAGVDALIVQGHEAGGHIRGKSPLFDILPEIAEYATVPVVAAGGICRGQDLVKALNYGASGVCCGTLFLVTEESNAHAYHKQLVVESNGDDTVITDKFWRNWHEPSPVRVLKCCLNNLAKVLPSLSRVIGMQDGKPVYLYSTDSPLRGGGGQFELMALYASVSCSHIHKVDKVSVVMGELLHEAGVVSESNNSETY